MRRASPSMVISVLALFVALGGTGYAAAKLNGRNLVNRSVTAVKIKRNALGGTEINEARLRAVPDALRLGGRPAGDYVTKDAVPPTVLPAPGPASDSAKLGGKDPSAYLAADATAANAAKLGGKAPGEYLAAGGKAADADKLDGLDSTDFMSADGTAADAAKLGGKAPSEYLAATGKAADADKLDGKDATEFLASTKVQAAGPVVLDMHPLNNASVNTPIAIFGPYQLHAVCTNSGGSPIARVGIASSIEFFLEAGETASHSVIPRAESPTIHTFLAATASGGTQWDSASTTFSAIANPTAGSGAMQGAATVIASNGGAGGKRCYVSAWAVTS